MITRDPKMMGGVPCIAGTRIPVATVLARLADGIRHSEIKCDELLSDYPDLAIQDVIDCLECGSFTCEDDDGIR